MDTKLTLKLDKEVIESAKKYAAVHKRSLSGIIEAYLKSLVSRQTDNKKQEKDDGGIQISPFVKSMATGIHIPAELDDKTIYPDHLEEKYR